MVKRIIIYTLILLRKNKLRTILLCVGLLTTAFSFSLGNVLTTNIALSSMAPYKNFPTNVAVVRSNYQVSDYSVIEDFDSNLKYCFYSVSTINGAIISENTYINTKICYTTSEFVNYPVLSCDTEDAVEETEIIAGRNFVLEDKYSSYSPAIIHNATARLLFGDTNPLGQIIKLENGATYIVIGILKDTPDILRTLSKNEQLSFNIFTLAQTKTCDYIVCVADGNIGDDYAEKMNQFFSNEIASYCRITTYESIYNEQNQIKEDAQKSVFLLSFIMYIVCTIFIFSIMLFFVKERVVEIGIRLSVGAQNKDISFQFLLEMLILAVVSGIIGTIIGLFVGSLISYIFVNLAGMSHIDIPLTAIILPTLLSVTMALIASLIPSILASKMTIKECLQFE